MSIFNEHISNEILMAERFKILSLSYSSNFDVDLRFQGNPFRLFFDQNISFPVYYFDKIEPKRFESLKRDYVDPYILSLEGAYRISPESFTCTYNNDRFTVNKNNIINKNYLSNLDNASDNSFLSILLHNCLNHIKIDKYFTPELFKLSNTEDNLYWYDFWKSACYKMIDMMKKMINHKYHVDIKFNILACNITHATVMFRFDFNSINEISCNWWYTENPIKLGNSLSNKLAVSPSKLNIISPFFKVFAGINFLV